MSTLATRTARSLAIAVGWVRLFELLSVTAGRLAAWPADQTSARATVDGHADAAAVRERARQYLASDPGFAADLIAAANRHEQALIEGAPGTE